jgi:hypothetical protein
MVIWDLLEELEHQLWKIRPNGVLSLLYGLLEIEYT